MAEHRHHWIRATHRSAADAARPGLELPPVLATVSAHRRLRGPYTAAGSVLRAVVPDALERCPDAVARHDVEILSAAPELRRTVQATRETLTSLAIPKERTRFYSRLRTLRLSHGLVEFLTAYARSLDDGPRTLVVEDLQHADPTDQEFVAVLLRRADPALITVVAVTDTAGPTAVDGPTEAPLPAALAAHCAALDVDGPPPALPADPARAWVDSDGTADDPRLAEAYRALPAEQRAALHDRRQQELAALDQESLALGALTWHAQYGSDRPAAVTALRRALDTCIDLGFYHATVELGERGLTLVEPADDLDAWWAFTTKMTTSFAALGLPERSLPFYTEARAVTTHPVVHMQAAYATSMLYTRHFDATQRDHLLARGWINQAIALAEQMPDPKERVARAVFNRNGLALIEMHQGNLAGALTLLDECLAKLDETLAPDEHALHRSVLRHNRAQVTGQLGMHAESIADFTEVITLDPNYAEYHFDRGLAHRSLGRPVEALADFEQAVRLSPPFPEAYYNRADVRSELGDLEGAVADFGYVLELDPAFPDAHLNRAGLLLALGEAEAAWQDVRDGLELTPDSAELLCLKAQLHLDADNIEQALEALGRALAADPDYAPGWALRGALGYERGDLPAAVADLGRAAELSPDPEIRFNLAVALRESGRTDAALELLDALLAEDDDPDVRAERELCLNSR
ncbi:tetratricopeptide repeat protein [Kitasatospora sp. MBT63]|uniref:tetratricopeptide repeat protein n=1 Tax=Kitasatospora sp. MBT63 TaxID=1444768 RepID=UPI000539C564|nr:tetratricopeptide repeat protein [Kitasatospora sp. MBT63]